MIGSLSQIVARFNWRQPKKGILSALLYVTLVGVLTLTSFFSLAGLFEQYWAGATNRELLAQLQERAKSASHDPNGGADTWPAGMPFLEGPTDTVATAGLLQRLTNAVSVVGGSLLSSEADARRAKDGYLRVTVTVELEQAALQPLIYDIEAGMPFLYIDQLQAQSATPDAEGGRMRVTFGVSGLWTGGQ